jgi:hypothetical protein
MQAATPPWFYTTVGGQVIDPAFYLFDTVIGSGG